MRVSDSSVGGEACQFHTTRRTLVLASARDQSKAGRAALTRSIGTRYFAAVREEVARTVSRSSEIEGEIGALSDALIADEGRVKQ